MWKATSHDLSSTPKEIPCADCHSRNLPFAKGCKSVHPTGHPISHSTHIGFSGPPTWSASPTWGSVRFLFVSFTTELLGSTIRALGVRHQRPRKVPTHSCLTHSYSTRYSAEPPFHFATSFTCCSRYFITTAGTSLSVFHRYTVPGCTRMLFANAALVISSPSSNCSNFIRPS